MQAVHDQVLYQLHGDLHSGRIRVPHLLGHRLGHQREFEMFSVVL